MPLPRSAPGSPQKEKAGRSQGRNDPESARLWEAMHWFTIWGTDPGDQSQVVWRIELRAGKDHLKKVWGIVTFSDVESRIGEVLAAAAQDIRYLEADQTDSNVSRQTVDPLWHLATEVVKEAVQHCRIGLSPDQLRDIDLSKAISTYFEQIRGLTAGLSILD